MIRRPIPTWLVYALGVTGVIVVLAIYAALSIRQTRINPDQNIFPGIQAFGEGIGEITKARGAKATPNRVG